MNERFSVEAIQEIKNLYVEIETRRVVQEYNLKRDILHEMFGSAYKVLEQTRSTLKKINVNSELFSNLISYAWELNDILNYWRVKSERHKLQDPLGPLPDAYHKSIIESWRIVIRSSKAISEKLRLELQFA